MELNLNQAGVCSHLSDLDLDCLSSFTLFLLISPYQRFHDPCSTWVMSETSKPWPTAQVSLSVLLFGHMGVGYHPKVLLFQYNSREKKLMKQKENREGGGGGFLHWAKINNCCLQEGNLQINRGKTVFKDVFYILEIIGALRVFKGQTSTDFLL